MTFYDPPNNSGGTIVAAMVSGPIMGGGTYWFAAVQFGFGTGLDEFYAAFAVPILLGLVLCPANNWTTGEGPSMLRHAPLHSRR